MENEKLLESQRESYRFHFRKQFSDAFYVQIGKHNYMLTYKLRNMQDIINYISKRKR